MGSRHFSVGCKLHLRSTHRRPHSVQGRSIFSDTLTMDESFPGLFSTESKDGAAESTEEIVGQFSHKLNNITATILGKAQLAKLAVTQGKISDPGGKLMAALEAIEAAVARIGESVAMLDALPGMKKE